MVISLRVNTMICSSSGHGDPGSVRIHSPEDLLPTEARPRIDLGDSFVVDVEGIGEINPSRSDARLYDLNLFGMAFLADFALKIRFQRADRETWWFETPVGSSKSSSSSATTVC
jgi:hypothetical protein